MQWRSCCAWYCCLLSLSGTLLLAYLSALCGWEVEYLEIDDKPRSTWVAGVGSGLYFLSFLGAGGYICWAKRRAVKQLRKPTQSYELLPLDSVDEEI